MLIKKKNKYVCITLYNTFDHLMTLDVNNGCVFILDENENPCINCEILFFLF